MCNCLLADRFGEIGQESFDNDAWGTEDCGYSEAVAREKARGRKANDALPSAPHFRGRVSHICKDNCVKMDNLSYCVCMVHKLYIFVVCTVYSATFICSCIIVCLFMCLSVCVLCLSVCLSTCLFMYSSI